MGMDHASGSKILSVRLTDVKKDETYRLSFPLQPERFDRLREKFPHFPLMVINSNREIIFGFDYYYYLEAAGISEVEVMQADIWEKDALILNYNMKESLTGLNLYEKLVFIEKILPLAEPEEVYRRTGLDIAITPPLKKYLSILLDAEFMPVLVSEQISLKSALRLCGFSGENREAMLRLFTNVAFSSSHQLKLLEMVGEILFRDKCSLAEIFDTLAIDSYMEQEKPQKVIIDAFFKYRNPQYSEAEIQWQREIASLNLPEYVKINHFPFFEKRQLSLSIDLKDKEELRRIIEALALEKKI